MRKERNYLRILIWSQKYAEEGEYRCMGEFDIEDALEVIDTAMFLDIEDDDGNLLSPSRIYYSFRERAVVIETE